MYASSIGLEPAKSRRAIATATHPSPDRSPVTRSALRPRTTSSASPLSLLDADSAARALTLFCCLSARAAALARPGLLRRGAVLRPPREQILHLALAELAQPDE